MDKNIGVPLTNEINVTHLMSAFFYELPENFDNLGERHPGWEFVYVERGRISIHAEDMTYILKSGEMVCHKPYEFHALKPYHGTASIIVFCFEGEGANMRYFNNKILSVNQRQKLYLNDIVENANRLLIPKDPVDISKDGTMDRSPDGTKANEQYLKNTIELLLLSLMSSHSTERQKRVVFYEQHLLRSTITAEIKSYLNEHLSEEVRLSDISSRFSYSLSSIKRIFKSETGYSIIEYLNNLRIEQAKELLKKNIPVEDIALMLGFANIYYFSTVFKSHTGKSPSKFRTDEKEKKNKKS